MATTRLGSNATTQDKLLKRVYEPMAHKQFNTKALLLQTVGRKNKNLARGEHISIPLHAGQGAGYEWTDNGALPAAGNQQIERATFVYKTLAGRIELDDEFVAQTMGHRAADLTPLDLEMKGMIVDQKTGLTVDLYGDGSGLLATPASASASNTVTLEAIKNLRNNMKVDILLKANGTVGPGGVRGAIITINRQTKTITLPNTATLVDGTGSDVNANPTDYGVYRSGSYNKACFGLEGIISAGNPPSGVGYYGGVDRTLDANDFYRSIVDDNGGTPRGITDHLMQNMVDDIESYSDGEVNLILMPFGVWDTIAEVLTAQKRFQGKTYKLNGWATAIDWAGIPCVRDKYCPDDRAYFLDTSTFRIYQDSEGSWMDSDGAILSRVPGYMAYEAAWRRRLQLVCSAPACNGAIIDLQYTAAV